MQRLVTREVGSWTSLDVKKDGHAASPTTSSTKFWCGRSSALIKLWSSSANGFSIGLKIADVASNVNHTSGPKFRDETRPSPLLLKNRPTNWSNIQHTRPYKFPTSQLKKKFFRLPGPFFFWPRFWSTRCSPWRAATCPSTSTSSAAWSLPGWWRGSN